MSLSEQMKKLVTRDQLRENCGIQLSDSDDVTTYWTAFVVDREYTLADLHTLFVKPSLISIGRYLEKRCKRADVGEPNVEVNGNKVMIHFPVKETGGPTIFLHYDLDRQQTLVKFGSTELALLDEIIPTPEVAARLKEAYKCATRGPGSALEIPYTDQNWADFKSIGALV
jgi:hypothetical protein